MMSENQVLGILYLQTPFPPPCSLHTHMHTFLLPVTELGTLVKYLIK